MNTIKKLIAGLLLAASACSLCSTAQAGVIQIETNKSSYQSGELITATLRASAFSDVLTGFFLALQYQPGQLSLQNFSFGNGFDDGLGSYQFSDHSSGSLALEEYADWAAALATLAAQQNGSFILATIQFKASGSGLFSLKLDPAYLGFLTAGGDLQDADWIGSSFSVTDNATVPAPAPLLLMSGLLLMLVRQRQSGQLS
ncbi:MAG: hypothetical protein U5L02_16180 [Rheinheimera sp.]|nr:hypothetical protein [Rheinheimera sp.]